jgi:hypothetical protein
MKSFFNFAAAALLAFGVMLSGPASAANANARPVIINRGELETSVSVLVYAAYGPVVIEFYDSKDPDTSGECAAQVAAFQAAQNRFAGKVTMIRADTQSQDANMIARERIAVCPTHVFVLTKDQQQIIGKRLFGPLTEDQFGELFEEFYKIPAHGRDYWLRLLSCAGGVGAVSIVSRRFHYGVGVAAIYFVIDFVKIESVHIIDFYPFKPLEWFPFSLLPDTIARLMWISTFLTSSVIGSAAGQSLIYVLSRRHHRSLRPID